MEFVIRDRPIWLFGADTDNRYLQHFQILFSASLSKIWCIPCFIFFCKNL